MPTKIKLTIQVPLEWWDKEEINELKKKGHTLIPLDPTVDLYLGPNCHYWVAEMFGESYLERAVKKVTKMRKEKDDGKG